MLLNPVLSLYLARDQIGQSQAAERIDLPPDRQCLRPNTLSVHLTRYAYRARTVLVLGHTYWFIPFMNNKYTEARRLWPRMVGGG